MANGRGRRTRTGESIPLLPRRRWELADKLTRVGIMAAVRATLPFTPRPSAILLRNMVAQGGAKTAAALEAHVPSGVSVQRDEPYGDHADERLDIFRPASVEEPLPTVLWVHGGGFVGGAKDELAGYFMLIASHGFTVVAPGYSLAPEHRYPTPTRQAMQALGYVQENAERLGVDIERLALGGDSAGAQIAAPTGASSAQALAGSGQRLTDRRRHRTVRRDAGSRWRFKQTDGR